MREGIGKKCSEGRYGWGSEGRYGWGSEGRYGVLREGMG